MRNVYSDPTANTAIANADRAIRRAEQAGRSAHRAAQPAAPSRQAAAQPPVRRPAYRLVTFNKDGTIRSSVEMDAPA